MTFDAQKNSLTVTRLQHGGYVVTDGIREPGDFRSWLFAATTIDEALAWMKARMTTSVDTCSCRPA